MTQGPNGSESRISPRVWIGLLVAAIVISFIAANPDETNITFLFAEAVVPLWLALGGTALGGFVAGWLIGRRRR